MKEINIPWNKLFLIIKENALLLYKQSWAVITFKIGKWEDKLYK